MKRNTKQAKVITEVIRSAGRPLTPSEIHEFASQNISQLGIATIYRHLKALCESMQVVGVDYPGQPPRYEWVDGKDKVHFTCRSCDKLYALADTTKNTPPAKVPKGFNVQGFEVMLYGMCPECG
ncbi:MAG: transcriptional repressor [Opitutae bacterium]|jgi:Fur family ferric uptake transcriptional regulator|nr:transcriptional repressor [Opitutae bacterium]